MTDKEKLELFLNGNCGSDHVEGMAAELTAAGLIFMDETEDDFEREEYGRWVYRPTATGRAILEPAR